MDYTKDITNHQKGKHFSLGDRRELQGILSDSSKQYSLRQAVEKLKEILEGGAAK